MRKRIQLNFKWIKERRSSLGLTQMEVARFSGISLPTLQNLESGKANPSWDILEKLGLTLGYSVELKPRPIDWNLLSQLGVPLTPNKETASSENENLLIELKKAIHEFLTNESLFDLRQKESLLAFLWAIRDHYPSSYKKIEKQISTRQLNRKLESHSKSRLIKLRRLALSMFEPRNFK